uniref:Uncharacterized protein n=1 Tax=Rhizophagus irregularis (strain DAOM 181602 / DAOM 197198 / MUCL 43194) TaxID=747089 RepID=U9SN74_RHIID
MLIAAIFGEMSINEIEFGESGRFGEMDLIKCTFYEISFRRNDETTKRPFVNVYVYNYSGFYNQDLFLVYY